MLSLTKWLLALSSTCVILKSYAAAEEQPCTARRGGRYYDLRPLKSSTDYSFKVPGGQEFFINVCKGVVHETWNPDAEHPENIAAFTRKGHGDFSLGEVNTTLLVRDRHPLLILTGGSPCTGAEQLRASTAVRFICDTSVFGSGKPRLVAQLPPNDESACAFFIEWRTHLACPTSEPSGFWGGLIIGMSMIALVLVMLYIVGGTLYRRYVLQQRGFDQIPRVSFFSFTDTLERIQSVRDRFAGQRARPWNNGDRSGPGFERLPSLPEEEEAILGSESDGQSHGHSFSNDAARESDRQAGILGSDVGTHGVIRL